MRIEGRLDALPQDDRRTTARRELRLRVASLAGESAAANVVVLDLSQTGLLLETSARMATGESLQIDLPHAGLQTAEVVWTSGADADFGLASDCFDAGVVEIDDRPLGVGHVDRRGDVVQRSAEPIRIAFDRSRGGVREVRCCPIVEGQVTLPRG